MITFRSLILVAGGALLVPFYAVGQSNDTLPLSQQLQEVTVTAEKQEENLQQVPVSVSHISELEIRNSRLWQARDLGGLLPNFYASHSGDGRNVMGIRGITTTSYDPARSEERRVGKECRSR